MATIYLSPSGNDSTGDGTSGTPYKTLFKCISVASTGDTIYHKAGTYTNLGTIATINTSVTITGDAGVTIDLATSPSNIYGTIFRSSVDTTWSGLTIDNYAYGADISTANWSLFGRTVDNVNLTLRNMVISNAKSKGRSGYYVGSLISSTYTGGITKGGTMTIDRCLFYNIEQYGTTASTVSGYLFNSLGSATSPVIWNVTNCTFHFRAPTTGNSASNGIWHYQSYVIDTWKNNIFYNETGATVNWSYYTFGSTTTYQNNDAYLITSPPSGTGNITSDPLFIDLTNRNFHLRPSSPCVGTGQVI